MDHFEDRISDLMHYQTRAAAPFTAADIAAGSRRRGRVRVLASAAGALAVVAVGAGVVTLAGTGGSHLGATALAEAGSDPAAPRTPDPTTASGALPSLASSVLFAKPGERIPLTDGFTLTVTASTKCDITGDAFLGPAHSGGTTCRNVDDPNFGPHTRPSLDVQGSGGSRVFVITGEYLGPAAPALIDAVQDGKHLTASLVEVPGQHDWVAWYLVVPAGTWPSHAIGPSVTAYAADGSVLATMDPVVPRR